jgi:hypothetical protein
MSTAIERFISKVAFPAVWSACWPWIGQLDRYGYGKLSIEGRTQKAHRIAYEMAIAAIPKGLHIDHLCRVRHCVNPFHLEPVEKWVNDARGRGFVIPNSLKIACDHGHPFTPNNTRVWRGRRICRTCDRRRVAAYKMRKSLERAS